MSNSKQVSLSRGATSKCEGSEGLICVTIYTELTFYQAFPTSQNLLFEFAIL